MAASSYPMIGATPGQASSYPQAGSTIGNANLNMNTQGAQGSAVSMSNSGAPNTPGTATADQAPNMMGAPFQNPWAIANNPAARGPTDYPI